ncbi:B12-binding domain-containing radical SAM protein [Sulfuricurvum sp.]|uniref:B12-binding domain-containing radical SAM protein n=1 Tax=Sulfuricurvum sp. TaxID=2025608 RepID=UPI003BB65629
MELFIPNPGKALNYDFSDLDKSLLAPFATWIFNNTQKICWSDRGQFVWYILSLFEELRAKSLCIAEDKHYLIGSDLFDIPVVSYEEIGDVEYIVLSGLTPTDMYMQKIRFVDYKTISIFDAHNFTNHWNDKFYSLDAKGLLGEACDFDYAELFLPNLLERDGSALDIEIIDTFANLIDTNVHTVTGDKELFHYFTSVSDKFANMKFVQEIEFGATNLFLCSLDEVVLFSLEQKIAQGSINMRFTQQLISPKLIPERALKKYVRHIYPIEIPEIAFAHELDFLLLDLPARERSLAPNGLGYVHNILRKLNIKFQTCDLDNIIYHRIYQDLLLKDKKPIGMNGLLIPEHPWETTELWVWSDERFLNEMNEYIVEIADKICVSSPKIIGLSLHFSNIEFSVKVINLVRQRLKEVKIVVGGFSCANYKTALKTFPLADFVIVGEAELSLPVLIDAILNKKETDTLAGVLPYKDVFIPAPLVENLDELDAVEYEWHDIALYRRFDGYSQTPIVSSRGCRWSRCTFCAECFSWRNRTPKHFVDEVESLYTKGLNKFLFNESDLNGDPDALLAICDEIIERKLKVTFSGQLRIHTASDIVFFEKLRKAGFTALTFGVDGWSKNTLRLQKKGYSKRTVRDNLIACQASGIQADVNMVLGVPGETWDDIEESIEFAKELRVYIRRFSAINSLILASGSRYYDDPDTYDIKFYGNRNEIMKAYPNAIPDGLWYSEKPFIDHVERSKRLKYVVDELLKAGAEIGGYAKWSINQKIKSIDSAYGVADEMA